MAHAAAQPLCHTCGRLTPSCLVLSQALLCWPSNNHPRQPQIDKALLPWLLGLLSLAQTFDAILDPQFWQFASTENTQGVSVEDPHNSIHVFCG